MKKIALLFLISFIIFVIYEFNNKHEEIVFSIGNNSGDIVYEIENGRITDIIIGIESNKKIGDYDFQHILVKATTIEIIIDKFIVLSGYPEIATQLKDLEKLLVLLRKYNKEIIKIKLIKEDSEFIEYVNQKISILCYKYDIIVTR